MKLILPIITLVVIGCMPASKVRTVQQLKTTAITQVNEYAVTHIVAFDTTHLLLHDFVNVGNDRWLGYAIDYDHNGVYQDSIQLVLLPLIVIDVNRDGHTNIIDVMRLIEYLFKGGI